MIFERSLTLTLLSFQRRLNVYIEFTEHMHLPFANDSELKENAERCHAFDQGN